MKVSDKFKAWYRKPRSFGGFYVLAVVSVSVTLLAALTAIIALVFAVNFIKSIFGVETTAIFITLIVIMVCIFGISFEIADIWYRKSKYY